MWRFAFVTECALLLLCLLLMCCAEDVPEPLTEEDLLDTIDIDAQFITLARGLVGYWPFDAGTAEDYSGMGNNGTIHGNPRSVVGVVGKALDFSEGSRVHIPASKSLHGDIFKDAFTLAAWVRPTLTGDQWQHVWRSVNKNDEPQDTLFLNTAGFFSWRGRVGGVWGERSVTPGGMIKAHEWTHVAVVGNRKALKIYVNSKEARNVPFVEQDGGIADFYLGFDDRQLAERFSGAIDEVYVFTRALTGNEIKKLMEQGLSAAAIYAR